MNYKRIFVIVCDSMGIGNAKDADMMIWEQILFNIFVKNVMV